MATPLLRNARRNRVLGRTIPLSDGEPPFTIVGLARDARYYELDESPHAQVYGSLLQLWQPVVTFLLKTTGDPMLLRASVQHTLHALDPNLALDPIETLESVHAAQMARFRASAHVVGLSGLFALLLACAGLYGVMAYRVSQRTREIGLRLALGATGQQIARDVLGRGLRLVLTGTTLGLATSLALGRVAEGLLFNVQPRDAVSLIAAPAVLLLVAGSALLVPARRAMRVEPMIAIK